MKLRRVLFQPDTHAPYHSKGAVELLLTVMRGWQPDVHVIGGDHSDCATVSFHEKTMRDRRPLKWELDVAAGLLDEYEALMPRAQRIYLMGNHEERLNRFIAVRAPELHGMLDLSSYLRLKERGYLVVPYRKSTKLGKLHITHDFGRVGRRAHLDAINDVLGNAVINHTHHLGVEYAGSATGESHVGASFGWLGDVEEIDYVHEAVARRNWHLGFGIGYMEENGTVHLQAVPIIRTGNKYRCVVEGQLYQI